MGGHTACPGSGANEDGTHTISTRRRLIARLRVSGERYELRAWVVMPNHVHVVVWPMPGHTLSEILHSWKSCTSKEANKLLRRAGGKFWQDESFDHWLRDDEERARLVTYVENNPVKAGLCQRSGDWKWSSAYGRPA